MMPFVTAGMCLGLGRCSSSHSFQTAITRGLDLEVDTKARNRENGCRAFAGQQHTLSSGKEVGHHRPLQPMDLTIRLPDEDVATLKAKVTARGVSAEEYALRVLEQDLAPEWLRQSWASAKEPGVDQLSMDEIDAEIAAAQKARREAKPRPICLRYP